MTDEQRYRAVDEVLQAVSANHGAAAAHGMLAGMLSAQPDPERSRWIAEVLDGTAPRGDAAKQCLAVLSELYEHARGAMEDAELTFEPLLPPDESELSERASALGSWCEGFLLGLGLAGADRDEALPADVREVLQDFGEMARVDPDTGADEEDESSYAELAEYARVGALLVREHLALKTRALGGSESGTAVRPDSDDDITLH